MALGDIVSSGGITLAVEIYDRCMNTGNPSSCRGEVFKRLRKIHTGESYQTYNAVFNRAVAARDNGKRYRQSGGNYSIPDLGYADARSATSGLKPRPDITYVYDVTVRIEGINRKGERREFDKYFPVFSSTPLNRQSIEDNARIAAAKIVQAMLESDSWRSIDEPTISIRSAYRK